MRGTADIFAEFKTKRLLRLPVPLLKRALEYREQNRSGDHICYISNLGKMKEHYPGWDITKSLDGIFQEIYASWADRTKGA